MKYGVALPCTTPRAVAKLAQLVEESGWYGCFWGMHLDPGSHDQHSSGGDDHQILEYDCPEFKLKE